MAQFINSKETLVTDAIDGLLAASGGTLTRLDGYPHIKVVYRSDWDKSKVALISGGGSGHEPAHAGFVGQGMLTAAICGDVFASPSVEAVLAGILAVTGMAGCLLIVKNYTGDRLNFGLAAEQARALGYKVEIIVVNDDIAIPDIPQPRGVAGTIFVHKIAGALAESGCELDTIKAAATAIVGKVASIAMSLDTCTVPGSQKENRIEIGKAELGLGIHGEPGVEQVSFTTAKAALSVMLEKLNIKSGKDSTVALINNLGSTTPLEMAVLTRAFCEADIARYIIGPAPIMTALDMHGFSISLMPTKAEELNALRAPVTIAAWPSIKEIKSIRVATLPKDLNLIKPIPSRDEKTKKILTRLCYALVQSEKALNELDAKSGDGDTGSSLATAAQALRAKLDTMPLADLQRLLPAIGNDLQQTMGGSLGVLLAIFFNAAGEACANGATISGALSAALKRVSEIGGAKVGDRTMIDALAPAIETLPLGLVQAAKAARDGANHTASIGRAKAGRATYVPEENLIGHNDPGAEAIALVFEELVREDDSE